MPATLEQDEHKPAANGVLVQMEQDKERKETNDQSARTELLNGDIGDVSTEQCEDHSPLQTDRTVPGGHTDSVDSKSRTENEHGNEEGSTEHKVCAGSYAQ